MKFTFVSFVALLILTVVRSVLESYRHRAEKNFLYHSAGSARGPWPTCSIKPHSLWPDGASLS